MVFFVATKNEGKKKELLRILSPLGIEVISEKDLPTPLGDVEENGTTFEENALIKARYASKQNALNSNVLLISHLWQRQSSCTFFVKKLCKH